MLTLQPAFDGTDQLRLIDRIVNDRPKPPRLIDGRVPRDLETIVLRALAKDPKDRFGSAGAMAEELRRFIAGRPIHSRPVSIAERRRRWCKRDP
jgi:serine/threonine protein kinase